VSGNGDSEGDFMAKNKKHSTIGDMLKDIKKLFNQSLESQSYIPDIITFCESPAYLGLPHRPTPINLYPIQKIMLKAFYRGTPGNENLTLTPEEIAICKEVGLDTEKNGDVLGKWKTGAIFNELVLVWGRRSGKDFVISIIALYEAMKLIECPGGDPYKMYELGSASPFTILTIAGSARQAGILYKEIKDKLLAAPYFRDKFIKEGILQDTIYLQTPQNKRDNEELEKKGLPPFPGSIEIRAGHSNSNTLVGIQCYVLLFDEVATFKQTGGSSSGEQLYGNLSPTVATFVRKKLAKNPETGEMEPVLKVNPDSGKLEEEVIYDGKIISISSPRGMDGVFWRLYSEANTKPQRLMCRLPTWVVAPKHKEHALREQDQSMTDEKFRMEYGAEFSGTEGENFFPPDLVEACFKEHYYKLSDLGIPGVTYFAHLDPAISSHNYALCVVHKHCFLNRQEGKIDYHIVLDHIKLWTPKEGQPVNIDEVDDYMIYLNRRFHLGMVTYDQWNSQSSINKLRKAGIPAQCTRFNKSYKIEIYDELHHLVADKKLKLPFHKTLRDEMMNLQRKFMAQGYRIYPKTEGEVRTDDCCDALAGAVYNSLKTEAQRLPQAKLVNMGLTPGAGNNVLWRSMQGTPYGYGSGQQVARNLERRSNAWRNRSGN
jgi:hypothetical protein